MTSASHQPAAAWKIFMLRTLRLANYWALRKLRPGIRTLAGLAFIVGGIFGFLPILGFWMIPVGLYLIAMEIPGYRRGLRNWLLTQKQRIIHGRPSRQND